MSRLALVAILVVPLTAGALYWGFGRAARIEEALESQLERRGRVAVLSPTGLFEGLDVEGTTFVPAEGELADALRGTDDEAVASALRAGGFEALLVESGDEAGDDASIADRLAAYDHIEALRGVYLSPTGALYAPGVRAELGAAAQATARVARRILDGTPPPSHDQYPEELRRIRNVEVMVLLRDFGTARLWRSARGSSIASALETATLAARQRWRERQQALGGALDDRLPGLDVEVSLLEEDGTLGAVTPAFVERVFGEEHGVAYERPGAWRYLLPDATQRAGEGSAIAAFEDLFLDNALPRDSLARRDLRFYRLVVTELGRSTAGGFRDPLPDP